MEQISTSLTSEQGFNAVSGAGGFGTVCSPFFLNFQRGNEYQPSLQSFTTQTMLLLVLTMMWCLVWLLILATEQCRLLEFGLTVSGTEPSSGFTVTILITNTFNMHCLIPASVVYRSRRLHGPWPRYTWLRCCSWHVIICIVAAVVKKAPILLPPVGSTINMFSWIHDSIFIIACNDLLFCARESTTLVVADLLVKKHMNLSAEWFVPSSTCETVMSFYKLMCFNRIH